MVSLIEPARWRRLQSTEARASRSASASASRYCLAENIGFAAIVVAELELGKVERQIFLAHVVVGADYAALKQRPEAFNVVRVNDAPNVHVVATADNFVRPPTVRQGVVALCSSVITKSTLLEIVLRTKRIIVARSAFSII